MKILSFLESKQRHAISAKTYQEWYQESMNSPDEFWEKHGKRIAWFTPYRTVKNTCFEGDVSIKWYEDGTTNVAFNCIDRHLPARAQQTAFIWEGNEPDTARTVTYSELHSHVCRLSNVLKSHGVHKGDRVTIYMPMVLEAVYAMLACARIGAVHTVVFGGFSPQALAGRIIDCGSSFIISSTVSLRGKKPIYFKENVEQAVELAEEQNVFVDKILLVRGDETASEPQFKDDRYMWYDDEISKVDDVCACEVMNAEDPLFLLYTSGSTGKPKGVLHTTGGYLVYASMTHEYVFDYQEGDIYWCSADVGWITGHSYGVYGPLANGATSVLFEGVPNYPSLSRFWEVIEKHRVSIFYTAPTVLRALMGAGDSYVEGHDLTSLRVLGSVGEPINPHVWQWYYDVIGGQNCPIVDTWWQTETGGILIAPLPFACVLKPGSATKPFFGIRPQLLSSDGAVVEGSGAGNLCIADSWPGQARSLYGDHARFIATYFSQFKGYYFTGDGASRDEEGDYWITGRVDDVINVSGHRIGTAEIESALVSHGSVSEAAVVGYSHDVKGQALYCYVTLMTGITGSEGLKKELINYVRQEIGPFASPDIIQFVIDLPKTRSGKIMRRILRKIAENECDELGDISTLSDPEIVKNLIDNRQNR